MGTNLISGLSSGIDWKTMVDQLIAIDHRRVDLVSNKKTTETQKLSEWQSFNTKLLALKTAAGNLKDADAFSLYTATLTTDSATVKASDLLTVTASANASIGSYALTINSLARAQKISSGSFASLSDTIGAGHAGDFLINGTVIRVAATDTLTTLKEKINNANSGAHPTGVTAGIISYAAGDHRLVLTSDSTGASGIGLLNAGATDILNQFGFTDTSRVAKNHIAGGDRTDAFSSTAVSIQSLLGLSTTQTSGAGEIVINGQAIAAIDLSTDTLGSLQTKLAAAGLTVSITSETENNRTSYRLMVAGAANTYTDRNNILETLGLIKGGVSDVAGVAGDVPNTTGGAVMTADTLIKDIDGYTGYLDTDYIHLEGTDTNGIAVSDDTFALSETTTVGDLLAKIQSLFGDVTASVMGDGKVMVVDNTPGATPLAVTIGVKDSGGAADDTLKLDADGLLAGITRKRQIVAGSDASITVDGVTVTRSDNTIDDIMAGVTLNLLKADVGTTMTFNIGRDIDAIMAKMNSFVSSYNSISSYIHTQTSYDETKKKAGGRLFGDATLASVKSDLTSLLVQRIWGVSSDYATLGLVGINVDKEGQLSVNDGKLRGYLTTNFNDVQKLFAASGTTSVGTLEYITHGINTKQGDYTVHITAAATQSTSAPSDNTSLGGDETLTITSGSSAAVIGLTSGMSMAQIVNVVNSELSHSYTQILTASRQLYADGGQAAPITGSTKWNSVYDSSGSSANLADGDVISFTGTSRNGAILNGSYTISEVATDTVQGLLSAIETAFGNQVTAAVNASGQVVLTDKTQGSSSVGLTLLTTQAHDLDFGTVLTTNAGGQPGRYAMGLSATADPGNHLVLTYDSYGTGNSFTIRQQNNLLWTGGDQTVDNGLDVAGTINGEAATGSGQTLKGNSGEASVDGLSIKYTGSAGGVDAGMVKLTFGVAELFERSLFSITDSLEGYVSYKQQSLQGNISRYETQIDEMEARLDLKRESLINRFVQMEMAMQRVQNQSNWLASQITVAANGWVKNTK